MKLNFRCISACDVIYTIVPGIVDAIHTTSEDTRSDAHSDEEGSPPLMRTGKVLPLFTSSSSVPPALALLVTYKDKTPDHAADAMDTTEQ